MTTFKTYLNKYANHDFVLQQPNHECWERDEIIHTFVNHVAGHGHDVLASVKMGTPDDVVLSTLGIDPNDDVSAELMLSLVSRWRQFARDRRHDKENALVEFVGGSFLCENDGAYHTAKTHFGSDLLDVLRDGTGMTSPSDKEPEIVETDDRALFFRAVQVNPRLLPYGYYVSDKDGVVFFNRAYKPMFIWGGSPGSDDLFNVVRVRPFWVEYNDLHVFYNDGCQPYYRRDVFEKLADATAALFDFAFEMPPHCETNNAVRWDRLISLFPNKHALLNAA